MRPVFNRFGAFAIGFVTVSGACGSAHLVNTTQDTPITCTVTRQECTAERRDASCATFAPPTTIFGTTCYNSSVDGSMEDRCKKAFCTRPEANAWATYDYAGNPPCTVSAAPADTNLLPKSGTCTPTAAGVGLSRVDFIPRSRVCAPYTDNNPACQTLAIDPPPPPTAQTTCVDLSGSGAWKTTGIAPASDRRDPITQILRVFPGDATDCPTANASATQTSQLTTGQHATASFGGTTVGISITRGFASLGKSCDSEICLLTTVNSFRADVANMTVAGTQITNAAISLTQPALITPIPDPDGGGSGVAAHGLKFLVQGKINGADAIIRTENDRPWSVSAPGGGFRMTGTLTFLAADANGRLVPVTVNADIPGTPATPQNEQCANFTGQQRLFGFENVQDWSSSLATLSLVTSPVTQGCGALGIQGQGYIPIKGAAFATAGLPVSAAMSTDLFIPNNQPNQFWLGALQMYLTCPSGNLFNQYIGQVELTGKPQNAYSTLRFPLPALVQSTLSKNLNDCFFSYALNVNQTNRTWILDNLRFTQ